MWEINERFENNEKDEEIIPVRKPFTSGYVGKGKGYNRFVNWLNEVTPKINLENKIPENFQSWGKVFFLIFREIVSMKFKDMTPLSVVWF